MKLTPEDKALLTAEEIEALEGAAADQHLNTMGDDVPEVTAKEEQAEAGDDTEESSTDAAEEVAEAVTEAAKDEAEEPEAAAEVVSVTTQEPEFETHQPPRLPTYEVPEAADFAQRKTDLKAEKKAIEGKWAAGDLSDEQRAEQLDAVDDKLLALVAEQTRAETLRAINEQNAKAQQAAAEKALNDATVAVIQAAKKAGTIDYVADSDAQEQFDAFMGALERSKAWAGKSAADLVAQAHKSVLALRGIVAVAPAKAPAPAPAPVAPPKPVRRDVPQTLAGLPNAAPVGVQDELMQQVANLEGPELEAFLAGLPPGKLDKAMRAIDNMAAAR